MAQNDVLHCYILELNSIFYLTVKFVILFMCSLLDSLMQELALNNLLETVFQCSHVI